MESLLKQLCIRNCRPLKVLENSPTHVLFDPLNGCSFPELTISEGSTSRQLTPSLLTTLTDGSTYTCVTFPFACTATNYFQTFLVDRQSLGSDYVYVKIIVADMTSSTFATLTDIFYASNDDSANHPHMKSCEKINASYDTMTIELKCTCDGSSCKLHVYYSENLHRYPFSVCELTVL